MARHFSYFRYTLSGMLLLTGMACQKVVHLNLNTTTPQIAIEGEITDQRPPYQVNITTSVDFYSDNVFPPVSGAAIQVKDSTDNISDTLIETSPGWYTTQHFPKGIPGHTYSLFVSLQGKVYTAVSTMPLPVNLDSVNYQSSNLFGETTIRPTPYFQDPPGIANYYQFVEYINSVRLPKVFLFDDRLSDGRYISEPILNDTTDHLYPGDTLTLAMYCIDKPVWTYLNEVSLITDANSQSSAPANPQSNITGGCLGYFSAHTVSEMTSIIP